MGWPLLDGHRFYPSEATRKSLERFLAPLRGS